MSYKIVETIAENKYSEKFAKFKERTEIVRHWEIQTDNENTKYSFLVDSKDAEMIIDGIVRILQLKRHLDHNDELDNVITVLKLDSFLPQIDERTPSPHRSLSINRISTEEIYETVQGGMRISQNFILNMLCSVLVCCVGIIKNETLIFIAAAAISPALEPIIAYSFSLATARKDGLKGALETMLMGFVLALCVTVSVGFLFSMTDNQQFYLGIVKRAFNDMKYNSYTFLLATISGFSASLAIISGLSTTMASFMMSVSVIPVLCITGLTLSNKLYLMSADAFLMLIINIMCMILASQIVFRIKKVFPKTREEIEKWVMLISMNVLFFILFVVAFIYFKRNVVL